jgi:PAS domain S-box-containing protein
VIARKKVADPDRAAAKPVAEPANLAEVEFPQLGLSGEWRHELLEPACWSKVLETFAVTMKLAVALTDTQGRLLGQCHNPQPVWRLISEAKPIAASECHFCLSPPAFCNAARDALRTGKPTMVEDHAGLAHVGVPLSLGGQQLGTLIAGQVFTRYPEKLPLERVARDSRISRARLWQEAIQQVPITRGTLTLYGNLLMSLGQAVLGERYAAILHIKLAQTNERYRLFLDGVKDYALYTVDPGGRVTSWNRGAERLFGYTEAEVIGQDSSSLLVKGTPNREAMQQARVEADRSGSVEFEGWRVRKDGTRFFGAGMMASMGKDGAREYGGLVHDVTEVRRSEQDLQQAQKLEGIGVLAGGIAHDFNNLLTGILGGLSFVKDSLPADHPSYRMLEIAERSSVRASELVAQLLAYAGKGKFVVTRFDLSALIFEMLPLIAASIPKTVHLDLALTPGLPSMEADASQIRQIVMNLIINGAEAIGADGGTVRVSSGVSESGDEVFMQVTDSGSGMSETTKAKMFDPFFTTKFTGRGLGLAAVSGIVRSHKGKMQVDTVPGQGTVFTVTFPVERGERPADLSRLPDKPPTAVAPGFGAILVVDDEPALREMAAMILKDSGYTVLTASDGREAVDMFGQGAHKIAAVLLDMTMPIMGGHEAFRLIREMQPAIPIVLSSGYSEVAARAELGGEAVAGFIQKPYTAAKLVASMQEALEHSTRRDISLPLG